MVKAKKHIPEKGYPTTSKYYPVAHMLASREEKKKFGAKPYKKLESIAKKHPSELLGTHDAKGHVVISSVVPAHFVPEVSFHEKLESKLMERLRRK